MSLDNEAADWFARMRGPAAETAREQFALWYAEPAHRQAYERQLQVWDRTKFLANSAIGRARNLHGVRRSPSRGLVTALVASGLLVLIGSFAVLNWRAPEMVTSQVSAYRLEIARTDEAPRRIALPDGSMVILDRGARMEVAYDGHDRRLRLIQGRGRFTVAHDPGHPFIVEAAGGRVIAHGTIFDVAVVQSIARVALLQGAVEVRAEGAQAGRRQVDLIAGQRVDLGSRSISRPLAIMPAEQRWPNDMLELDGVALSRATDMFNRTSRIRVTVAPAAARGRTVSGAFRRGDPEGFAAQIAETFGLSVEHGAGGELTLRGS